MKWHGFSLYVWNEIKMVVYKKLLEKLVEDECGPLTVSSFYIDLFQEHNLSCPDVPVACDRCGKTDIPRGKVGWKSHLAQMNCHLC